MSNCGEGPIQDSIDRAAVRKQDRDRDPSMTYIYERRIRVAELEEVNKMAEETKDQVQEVRETTAKEEIEKARRLLARQISGRLAYANKPEELIGLATALEHISW